MEKETKVIKEKVNTETSAAKIERVAAAMVHEEIDEELTPLKSQLNAIQSALNQLESSGAAEYEFITFTESATT